MLPDTSAPFNTIYYFYRAVGENNWEEAQRFVTPALWSYLKTSGFISAWEERKRRDSTLTFIFFLVREQGVNPRAGTAWALGEHRWTSRFPLLREPTETVLLVWTPQGWKIKEIKSFTAAEAADEFYTAINAADWRKLQELTAPEYWLKLGASGVLQALALERNRSQTGVYVVFHIRDFTENAREGWVEGEAIWQPLTEVQRETPVTIYLMRREEKWQVARIIGHWEIAK